MRAINELRIMGEQAHPLIRHKTGRTKGPDRSTSAVFTLPGIRLCGTVNTGQVTNGAGSALTSACAAAPPF